MTQKRIQDYGSNVVAQSLTTLTGSIVKSAVLDGMIFAVDGPDRIRINPGAAVTHQGVIIIEDEPKFVTIANTASPQDYTVFYQHENVNVSGGDAAILTIQSGLLTADVVEGVILGYVRYPGGGGPISTSHFIQPYPAKIGSIEPSRQNANWLIPIKQNGYMITSTSGAPITITDVYDTGGPVPQMYAKFRNNALVTGGVVLHFPFKVNERPFGLLQMILGADINATVTPSFIDSDGTLTSLLITAITGIPALTFYSIELPRTSQQDPNSLVYLRLEINAAPSREVKLQAIGLNEYNLPI